MHRTRSVPLVIDPIAAILRDSKGVIARAKPKSLPAHHHSRIQKRVACNRVQLAKAEWFIIMNRSLESIPLSCDYFVRGGHSLDFHCVGIAKFHLKNLEAVSNHVSFSRPNVILIENDQIVIRRIDFDRPALLSSLLVHQHGKKHCALRNEAGISVVQIVLRLEVTSELIGNI